MAGQSELFYAIMKRKFDEEDVGYIRRGLCSMLSGRENPNASFMGCYDFGKGPLYCADAPADLYDCSSITSDCFKDSSRNDDDSGSDSGYKSMSSPSSLRFQTNVAPALVYSDIIANGIDEEDLNYIEKSFNESLCDVNEKYWTSKTFWDYHPPTTVEEEPVTLSDDSRVLKSGCARCEGYFKVNKVLDQKVKTVRINQKDKETDISYRCRTLYSKKYKANKQPLSRDARNDQRRLLTAFQTITDSGLLKLNELKFRKKKLRLGKSDIHGLGLFASEPISPNEIIIEYVGQMIRPIIADLRERQYKTSGLGSYCFKVDEDTIIDATKYGNLNRYINHSCSPNSYAKILTIGNDKKIVIYSKKYIKINEEITYDYKMPFEDDKIKCLCRAPGCRRYLN